jgi:hypothetical protein
MLTQARLKEVLYWNGENFIWIYGNKNNHIAGSKHAKGYRSIRIDGKSYLEHRLVWLWFHGCFPRLDLDHIDRNKANNKISNLREATNAQNHQNQNIRINNTSGSIGIHFRKDCQKWRAAIKVNGKQIYLGYFAEKSLAIAARKQAEKLFHPFQA